MTDSQIHAFSLRLNAADEHLDRITRIVHRVRGHDSYAYRLGMEQITADIDAIWPDTRAVAQPWFKDWLPPRTGGSFLAQLDKQLKNVYSDMAQQMNRQLYGDSPMLHGISEGASPFWKASVIKRPWWKRLLRR